MIPRLLRIDAASWRRFATYSASGSITVLVGAYTLMAWNRFGAQGVTSPRASVRLILIGFYGWVGLALAMWAVRWVMSRTQQSPSVADLQRLVWLTGFAHIPLLLLALAVQISGVMLQLLGPGLIASAFTFVLWMPAMLVGVARNTFDVNIQRAILIVAAPYLVWLLVVGRHVLQLIDHLL